MEVRVLLPQPFFGPQALTVKPPVLTRQNSEHYRGVPPVSRREAVRLALKYRMQFRKDVVTCLLIGDPLWLIDSRREAEQFRATAGKVPTDPVLLNIMLLQMVVSAFWFTSSVVPMAINQHERMARAMLAATCLALTLAWLLLHVNSLGLRGAVIALIAGDLFTAFYVLRESLRLLGDDPGDFARSLLDLSLLQRLWKRPKLPLANEE